MVVMKVAIFWVIVPCSFGRTPIYIRTTRRYIPRRQHLSGFVCGEMVRRILAPFRRSVFTNA